MERGHATTLTTDVALREVAVQLAPGRPALQLQHLSGRLHWQHDGLRDSWATEQLAFRTHNGLDWPGGNVRYTQTRTAPQAGQHMAPDTAHELHAEQLDLALLHQLADHLPLPQPMASPLASLQPQGRVHSLRAQWRSHTAADATPVTDWRVQGDIRDLTLAAAPAAMHAERNDIQGQFDKLAQEVAKQSHKQSLLELKAPQDGVVKDLATHTAGTVVQPGTILLTWYQGRNSSGRGMGVQ